MVVADAGTGGNINTTSSNTQVDSTSSVNTSASASGANTSSPTNTTAYQTNTTGNTYDVEEVDLTTDSNEGLFEKAGKQIDTGVATIGSAISSGLSAIGGFFSNVGKAIVDTGAHVASSVSSWVSDRIADLKGIGATLAETASNVASNVSSLLGNFGNWVTKTALPAVGTALKKTGASIGNVVTGLIQGVGQFGEALVDTCAIVGTGVASAFTGLYDFGQFVVGKITGNENWHSVTKDMWGGTMEFVQKERVKEAFKKFHENTPLGKWLDENAYAPFKSDGTGYKIANGVGYIAGIIALTIATMGIGTAVSGGATAASGATAAASAASSNVIHLGSMATIEITKQSIISGTIAAAAGFGKNTEAAWNDGAGLGGGLAYGAAKGLWEGVEMFLGASINSLKLANLGGGAVVQQLATTGTHVALDTIDGASASFIDPLMQMIYNPNETNMEEIMHIVNFDENGNQISNKTWDDLSFTEKYEALFKYHGGWQGVMTAAGSAAAMSFLTEIPDIKKAVKGTNTIETIAATAAGGTAAAGAVKEMGSGMGEEAGKETTAVVTKQIESTVAGDASTGAKAATSEAAGGAVASDATSAIDAGASAAGAAKSIDVPKSDLELYLEKYMKNPDVTAPTGIPREIIDYLEAYKKDPDITMPTGMPKEIVDFVSSQSKGMGDASLDAAAGTAKSSIPDVDGGAAKAAMNEGETAATDAATAATKSSVSDVDGGASKAAMDGSEATTSSASSVTPTVKKPSYFDGIESRTKFDVSDEQIEGLARRLGISESEVRVILNDKMKQFFDESEMGCRVSQDTLEKILFGDGMFKSQFETGTSDGAFNPELRKRVEEKLFGVPKDLDAADRPIYGMMFPKTDDPGLGDYVRTGPGYWYGNEDGVIAIFDKSKIKEATTYTIGDSLDYEPRVSAGLASSPSFDSGFRTFGAGITTPDQLKKATLQDLFQGLAGDDYLEIQIHGAAAHSIENVTEVIFTREAPSQQVIDELTRRGIKYTILK